MPRGSIGSGTSYHRRALLRAGLAGMAGLSAAYLAACGGGSSSGGSGSSGGSAASTSAPGGAAPTVVVAAATGTPKRGGVFNNAETAAGLASFDPYNNTNRAAQVIAAHTYSKLVKFKTGPNADDFLNLDIVGDLAESWEVPADGTSVTFKLRPNAKMHPTPPINGRQVTSEDIKFSLERYKNAPRNSNKAVFDQVTSVETPNPTTAIFKMSEPYAPILSLLADSQYLWIMPKETDSGFDPTKQQIGSGPFMIEEATPNIGVKFKRFNDYYIKDQPYLDNVFRPTIPDPAQLLAQYQAGKVDYFSARFDNKADLEKSNPKSQIIPFLTTGLGNTITMQQRGNSHFKDPRVRRALSLAVDRKSLMDLQYGGQGIKTTSVFPPGFRKYWVDPTSAEAGPGSQWFKFDPKAARDLLKAAGQENLAFRYIYTNNAYGSNFNQTAEAVPPMLKDAGFNPNIVIQDYQREYIEATRGSFTTGNYEGVLYAAMPPFTDPHFILTTFYHPKSPRNASGVDDPRLTDMIADQVKTMDTAARTKKLKDLQAYALNEVNYATLGVGFEFVFLQPWIRNYFYSQVGFGGHIAESLIQTWIDKS